MKKSRLALAIILAFILIIICISVPTASWFTRPYPTDNVVDATEAQGEKMELTNKHVYPAYNGYNVSIATHSSSDGTNNSYETEVTGSGTGLDGLSGSDILAYNKKYFCTTITNNSGSDQNVSLYISKLSIPTSSQGTLALGVNEPTRGYRDYSSLAHPTFTTSNNTMRVYFEKDNSVTGWNGTDFYICWNEDPNTGIESLDATGSNGTYTKLQWVGDAGHLNHYYADIPRTATHAFFCVANWGTHNDGNEDWAQRSQTLWNLAQDGQAWNTPKLYKITSGWSGSNHTVAVYNSPGVGVNQFYSSISVAVGNTYNAALQSGSYIGGSVEYYSSDSNVFTVNKTTGVVTAVATGEATLYSKIINSSNGYWDAMQVETTIKVTAQGYYEFNDVPIVKNLKISGATENSANVAKVYWYILNNSGSNLSYTINKIYLGP